MEKNIRVNNTIWIDYLRVVSTLAVIMIHVSALGVMTLNIGSENWLIANFYESISRFSVPMFFMISGALLLNKDYGLKEFFKKRSIRILPPLIFWSIIYFLFHNKFFLLESFEINSFIKKLMRSLLYGSNYHLGFVYLLIGMYLCVPITRIWIKNSSSTYIKYFLLIWLFTALYKIEGLVIYLPKIDVSNFTGYLGYMILGYYLFKVNFKFKNKYLFLVLFLCGIGITFLGTYYSSVHYGSLYEYFYQYLSLNVILTSSALFLFFKNINIASNSLNSIVLMVSKYSFGIYLIHALILDLLLKLNINIFILNPIFSMPLIAVLCLLISLGIIFLINKLPYGKYISG